VILPSSLRWIYVGLRLAIPYALICAVIRELIASNRGVGFVLQSAAGQFDTAGLFAGPFVLTIISTLLNEVLIELRRACCAGRTWAATSSRSSVDIRAQRKHQVATQPGRDA
jgi:ABC-type nitrate/sulfonate/bicarbonate transport system permease component